VEEVSGIPGLGKARDIIMQFDLSEGLAVEAELVFPEKAEAAEFMTSAQKAVAEKMAELKAALAGKGLPTSPLDSLKLGPSPDGEDRVRAELTIGKEDLSTLVRLVSHVH
jgi:hypothetical protein